MGEPARRDALLRTNPRHVVGQLPEGLEVERSQPRDPAGIAVVLDARTARPSGRSSGRSARASATARGRTRRRRPDAGAVAIKSSRQDHVRQRSGTCLPGRSTRRSSRPRALQHELPGGDDRQCSRKRLRRRTASSELELLWKRIGYRISKPSQAATRMAVSSTDGDRPAWRGTADSHGRLQTASPTWCDRDRARNAVDAVYAPSTTCRYTGFESMQIIERTPSAGSMTSPRRCQSRPAGSADRRSIESAGHAKRRPNPDHRRSSIIELTFAGKRLLAKATTTFETELDSRLGSALSDRAFRQFTLALTALRAAASEKSARSRSWRARRP